MASADVMNTAQDTMKAVDIAPSAYSQIDNSAQVCKEDDLQYDLGNLSAFDTHPYQYKSEKTLAEDTRNNVQLLFNKIFDLPRNMSDAGPLALLPTPVSIIPREKPLPKPKVETRWEAFAKSKGIEKRKKTRMVYDESKEEYAPRWGYKRANSDMDDWAVPVKKGDDPYADPWNAKENEKKQRIEKNQRQHANNLEKGRGKQPTSSLPAGIPAELLDTQKGKEGTKASLAQAQVSTASMGTFDKKRVGEPVLKKVGKRNQYDPVATADGNEKDRSMNILNRILGKEENQGKKKARDDSDDDTSSKKKGKRGKKKLKNITKGRAKRAKR